MKRERLVPYGRDLTARPVADFDLPQSSCDPFHHHLGMLLAEVIEKFARFLGDPLRVRLGIRLHLLQALLANTLVNMSYSTLSMGLFALFRLLWDHLGAFLPALPTLKRPGSQPANGNRAVDAAYSILLAQTHDMRD